MFLSLVLLGVPSSFSLCPLQQFPNLTTEIAEITADQQINASDFISDEVRERLESFNDSGIAEINITQYQEQINAGIINQTFLDEQLAALQNLSDTFAALVSIKLLDNSLLGRRICVYAGNPASFLSHLLCGIFL